MKRLLVIPLVLLILRRVDSQNTVTGNALPCEDDNLSCASPNACLVLSEICDGNDDCPGGSPDEGFEFASLDCDGDFGPPLMFRCTNNEVVTLDLLCDGINQCTSGEDERSIICENKCRLPYYGGCDFSRECVTTTFGQNCGDCLSGYTQNQLADNPFTDPCIPAVFLTLDAASYDTSENDATVQVCVSGSVGTGVDLTDIAGQSFEVNLQLFAGSAMGGGVDYIWTSTPAVVTLTFDSTNLLQPQCMDITIIDDNLIEGGEAFSVSLTAQNNANGQIILQTSSASVSIADNDVATFQLSPTTYTVREDDGNAVVIVECIGGTLIFDIEVTFETVVLGSTAIAGLDYTATTMTLTFSAGTVSGATQTVNVGIINDGLVESVEFVNIRIFGLSVSTEFAVIAVGGGSGTITIINVNMLCDPPPDIANGVVTSTGISVGDTATYTCNSGFELVGDMVRTCTETVIGVMPEFTPAEPFCRPLCDAPPNIANGVVTFTTLTVGSTASYVCNSSFELVGVMVRTCTETVVGMTAVFIPAEPFCRPLCPDPPALVNGMVTFTGNSVGDIATYTCDADFYLVGSPTANCTPAPDMNSAAFIPAPPVCLQVTIRIEEELYTVAEDEGILTVCAEVVAVIPAGPLIRPVEFTLRVFQGPGTAVDGSDFTGVTVDLTFDPSNQNQLLCVQVDILDDIICEDTESFYAILETTDSAVVFAGQAPGAPRTGFSRIFIIDDDSATIQPEDPEYSVYEGPPTPYLTIPIVLNGTKGPGVECVVQVHTENGTAVAGEDFVAVYAEFTFSSSQTRNNFTVHTIDDLYPEPDEYFTVIVISTDPRCVAGRSAHVVIIDDEDCDDDPCDENAECTELVGRDNFTCTCIPPFEGDGFTCICPGGGDDPHFSIVLPTGHLLCYTVQGEHGFAFNLISNDKVQMNAMFLPDSRREEVTWLGAIGITVMNNGYKQSNATSLRFAAKENKVYIGDKVVLHARNIEKLTFSNGKLTISEAPPVEGFKYPEVLVNLHDVSLSFSIKFMNEHLDIFWQSTGVQTVNSHGLIGQFFRKGVEVDEVRKILIMPNKEPVPVMRRPVWSFMEREMKDDKLCWTAMNPGYQGDGLIDGTYFDYLVNDVLSTDFQFKKQQ